MKNLALILLMASMVTASCIKDPVRPNPILPSDGQINLSCITVGQQSYYLGYNILCNGEFGAPNYSGDTLLLEVVKIDGKTHFSESLTPNSTGYSGAAPIVYLAEDRGSYISIPNRDYSALFFFYESDSLWKNKPIETELLYDGCSMQYSNGDPFTGDEIGHTEDIVLGPITVSDQRVVSCEPFFELDGFLAYDNHLNVSHTVSLEGIMGPYATGWVRMK